MFYGTNIRRYFIHSMFYSMFFANSYVFLTYDKKSGNQIHIMIVFEPLACLLCYHTIVFLFLFATFAQLNLR